VAQSVYFTAASLALAAAGPVNFSVPSGNFGDALAGYVAKRMGAPIGRILLATNANDLLARAWANGRYQRAAASIATISPAMDIQAASNFERLLAWALDDAAETARLFGQFAQSGGFDIPARAHVEMKAHFSAASASDAEAEEAMRAHLRATDTLICPHTAVGFAAMRNAIAAEPHAFQDGPLVTLATAHPAKFPEAVESATGRRPELPERCADLYARPERIAPLGADIDAVKRFITARAQR